jgi:hypothetical protein
MNSKMLLQITSALERRSALGTTSFGSLYANLCSSPTLNCATQTWGSLSGAMAHAD